MIAFTRGSLYASREQGAAEGAVQRLTADDRLRIRHCRRSPVALSQTHFAHKDVVVVRAPKSGGVVVRSKAFKQESRMEQLRHYFYGVSGQLCPHSTVLPMSAVTLMVCARCGMSCVRALSTC